MSALNPNNPDPDPMIHLSLYASDAKAACYALDMLATRMPSLMRDGAVACAARFKSALDSAQNEIALFASIRKGYGERSTNRQKAERRNAAQIVDALLGAGYELNLNNDADEEGEGENEGLALKDWTRDRAVVLAAMFATDYETLCARLPDDKKKKRLGVFFVYGNADNGSEVVSDYHIPLEEVIGPVMEKWQDD